VTPAFRDVFQTRARRIRGALALRHVLDAAVVGTAIAVLASVALVALGKPRWTALALVLLGVVCGVVVARRRRFSDDEVALFVDARLGSGEVVTSALATTGDPPMREQIESDAARALGDASARAITPRVLFFRHAALPLALIVIAIAPRLVPVRAMKPRAELRSDRVTVPLEELRRVEALRDLVARTEAERARRAAIADRARALAERAKQGMDKRDALDALGKLRESVDAERAEKRTNDAARRAASRALAKSPDLGAAADALRRADLVAFDAEMERLARTLEADARKTALAALDEAREAAIARGDQALAGALDEQRRLLKKRAADSQALRELSRLLGDALPNDARRALARLDRNTPESREAIAEAMANAVEGLTKEERERLARALAARAAGMQGDDALSKADLDAVAKALQSNEGREALRRALKELANGKEATDSAAERALAAAGAAIGVAEARVAGAAAGAGTGSGQGQSAGDANGGEANGSNTRGGGEGLHAGTTPEVAGSSFAARASGTPLGGIPIGPAPGLSPATGAELPARPHMGALEAARAREVGAVERSNVPREYREQVGRYFAP
jgi:hypothetical protein